MKTDSDALINTMRAINATRREMICTEGHFHADFTYAESFIVLATMITTLDLRKAWNDESQRECALSVLAVLSQSLRDALDVHEIHSTDAIVEAFGIPEDALPILAMGIGLKGVSPLSDAVH